jgi:O-antigen biosynthesis protein
MLNLGQKSLKFDMKLSIIIVNYNVKYFLEQCLHSVKNAITAIDAEVFIVDNSSVDGSIEMLQEKFKEFRIIANQQNVGFSKANNQAIILSKGEYILLLNPDTVVEHDTFEKIIRFMDENPDAGGLGVKMVDGKGMFLPESKRGLPTPWVAFYKIFGFSRIFPKSEKFGRYHLGFLDKEKTHEVDILSGAFMLIRKSVLEQIGYLDEAFFMYGEDIDLSYRITKAGYKNYYYPEARIIHYKGESTKKGSLNYVLVFYNAMIIFARKHFSSKNAFHLSLLINMAIYFRAFMAILNRFFSRITLPLADAILIFGGLLFIKNYWEHKIIFPQGGSYPVEIVSVAVPFYIFTWLFSVLMSGGYDKPVKLSAIVKGLLVGTIIILTGYALLPEEFRFSRAIIIFGALWGVISMIGLRILFHLLKLRNFKLGVKLNKRFIIVGDKAEAERVADLLRKADMNPGFIGLVSMNESGNHSEGFIGQLGQIKEIISIYNIDEVIFCAKDIPAQTIIDIMSEWSTSQVDFKIAPPESLSIIGSKSINTSGDIYIIELDSIAHIRNRRSKRFIDVLIAFLLIPLIPLIIFIIRKPFGFLKNLLLVFIGKRTWVGFKRSVSSGGHKLPGLKKGILNPTDSIKAGQLTDEDIDRLNLLYARDYKITNDLQILLRGFSYLGRT